MTDRSKGGEQPRAMAQKGRSNQRQPSALPDDEWAKLSQRERFIRTARELGCDESGEEFERAFSRAFPPRKPGEPVAPYVEREPPKGSRRKTKPA